MSCGIQLGTGGEAGPQRMSKKKLIARRATGVSDRQVYFWVASISIISAISSGTAGRA
jgi:hypothetical protein